MRFLVPLWNKVKALRPAALSAPATRRLAIAAAFIVCTAAAFWYGRQGAAQVEATTTPLKQAKGVGSHTDYGKRVVAYIHDAPITREDLGEFLIERFGKERVDFLVNRRIVERACAAKGVFVTNEEVEAQLREDIKAMSALMTEEEFEKNVLKRFNKTLYEWKEDVIRPKLMLAKLVRPTVDVSEDELKMAYEARYGPRVDVRLICFLKDDRTFMKVYEEAKSSEEKFAHYARQSPISHLAMSGGKVPPIHKHFPDKDLEKEAFSLKEGEVSKLVDLKDGTRVMMKCDKIHGPDTAVTFAKVRLKLRDELFEQKVNAKIPVVFEELRKAADPRVVLERRTMTAAAAEPPPLPPLPKEISVPPTR